MIIDFHSHLYPPELKPAWLSKDSMGATIFSVDGLLKAQEKNGIDVNVISNPLVPLGGADIASLEGMRRYNDFVAELGSKHRPRIVGLAVTNPWGGDDFLKEVERAVEKGGLKGVGINSSLDGEYLDSERVHSFFQLISELDLPLFVHPPASPFGHLKEKALAEALARPFDTTVTIARLVFSGRLQEFPNLKLVFAHVGGVVTCLWGRLDCSYSLGRDPSFGEWGFQPPPHPPSYYLKKIYVDTACWHAPYLECAVKTLGADHVLLGSDFPPVTLPLAWSLGLVSELDIDAGAKALILGENAARLLSLEV